MEYKVLLKFTDLECEKTFLGPMNKNLNIIRKELNYNIAHMNDTLVIDASADFIKTGEIVNTIYFLCEKGISFQERDIIYIINRFNNSVNYDDTRKSILAFYQKKQVIVNTYDGKKIYAKTLTQQEYLKAMEDSCVVFATGSAGTGKTYLAVGYAVNMLKTNKVRKLIITRPAVEAGENLGFLPGDLRDKLDPYLQPLYDALRDMIPQQKLLSYWEDNTIEIAPLAFMRGRTLDNAFVILDEAQNATSSQLKMFLTRMGRNAKFIVTGDITQIDLPKNQKSGLPQAVEILDGIEGISIIQLTKRDVIRHKLVTKIINAYENNKNE